MGRAKPAIVACALFLAFGLRAAAESAEPGLLHGQWEIAGVVVQHNANGDDATRGKGMLSGKMTDCSTATVSTITFDGLDEFGAPLQLEGTRVGRGFVLRTPDGGMVLSGSILVVKEGFANKLRAEGYRAVEAGLRLYSACGKRVPG
ncbi:MAG: hypothetical protein JNJ88_19915 [Planctomycetes bacterium]|nr:hypothetical protein [Planctomycetota bacterium]